MRREHYGNLQTIDPPVYLFLRTAFVHGRWKREVHVRYERGQYLLCAAASAPRVGRRVGALTDLHLGKLEPAVDGAYQTAGRKEEQ